MGGKKLEVSEVEEKIKKQEALLKVPTDAEILEYNKIKEATIIKYRKKNKVIPRAKLDAFLSELAEKTNHIFDEQNRNAYVEIKKLKKRYSSLKDILPKVERVNVLYDVGFSEAPAIYFENFLDFRTRVYCAGWPISLTGGYFKHLLVQSKRNEVSIIRSQEFKDFFKKGVITKLAYDVGPYGKKEKLDFFEKVKDLVDFTIYSEKPEEKNAGQTRLERLYRKEKYLRSNPLSRNKSKKIED